MSGFYFPGGLGCQKDEGLDELRVIHHLVVIDVAQVRLMSVCFTCWQFIYFHQETELNFFVLLNI